MTEVGVNTRKEENNKDKKERSEKHVQKKGKNSTTYFKQKEGRHVNGIISNPSACLYPRVHYPYLHTKVPCNKV